MAFRTGIVALTFAVKHICHLLTSFRPSINTVLSDAVSAGTITSAQSATAANFLDSVQVACDIFRTVSGY